MNPGMTWANLMTLPNAGGMSWKKEAGRWTGQYSVCFAGTRPLVPVEDAVQTV